MGWDSLRVLRVLGVLWVLGGNGGPERAGIPGGTEGPVGAPGILDGLSRSEEH